MSPTTSSTRSSIVTMPAVPPYSSSTTAMCARVFLRSSSTRSAGRLSGTYMGSRTKSARLNGASPESSHQTFADFLLRRLDIQRNDLGPGSHYISCLFLVEVQDAGEHCAIGFVERAAR